MILRVTFRDNDYTQLLEKYFRNPLYISITNILDEYKEREDAEGIKIYCDTSKKIDECMNYLVYGKERNKELEEVFLVLLRNSINLFVDNNTYLKTNLDIALLDSVQDKDNNGEVVYYFTKHHTFITM